MTARPAPGHPTTAHSTGRRSLRRRTARNIALGIFFFILGVIGILIPVMPQLVFFFLSALFFSLVSPRLRRALRRFRKRHPKLDHAYSKWREKGRRKRREILRKASKLRHDIEDRFDPPPDHPHRS